MHPPFVPRVGLCRTCGRSVGFVWAGRGPELRSFLPVALTRLIKEPHVNATATAPRRSRRLLVPLATLVAAGGIVAASGATFATSTASTGLAASGTLTQVNSNSVAFAKSNLKPGDVVTGSVTITNKSSLPATFTLKEDEVTNTFAPKSDLALKITNGATVVSDTTLGAAGTVPLGTWTPGEARTFTYTVTFAQSASNLQQGKTAETRYTFTSVQTAAETFTGTQGGEQKTSGTEVIAEPVQ